MPAAPHMDFATVASAALAQAKSLLPEWFPNGKFRGREFVIGNIHGDVGESLSVNTLTGHWADFSTDHKGGDLIALYAAIHNINQAEAARKLSENLGTTPQKSATVHTIPSRDAIEWHGIFPVPADAPPPPDRHFKHGLPVHIAHYRNQNGALLALIYRCEPTPNEKIILPLTYCQNTKTNLRAWVWQSLPKPRSLYKTELLSQNPNARILVVEGERKCDDVNDMLPPDWIAVSWPNGAPSWDKSDWSILSNRHVVIWPDNDPPGIAAANNIARILATHKAQARVLTPPPGVGSAWDVGDAIAEGWDRNLLMQFINSQETPSIWHSDDAWNEADIPPRAWVARGFAERRNVTVLAGAGAAGKSMLLKAWAVAAVLGMPFSRFQPIAPLRVLSYNVEDDLDEERRRLSATLRYFNATPSHLAGKLRILGPTNVGTLVERDPNTNRLKVTEAMTAICHHIETFKPDILILDPLVELHTIEENDNTGLRAVIANFRQLSNTYNLATIIAHHVRKGAIAPGDPDMVRGAGSIVGAARVVFTVCGMSEEEATKLGIPTDSRKSFFRIDGAKINHAPLQDAEWFERTPFQLDNQEDVAAAIPWQPPQDLLTSSHYETIETEYILPSKIWCNGHKQLYDIVLNDGSLIQATDDHRVLTAKGWFTLREAFDQQLEILCLNQEVD